MMNTTKNTQSSQNTQKIPFAPVYPAPPLKFNTELKSLEDMYDTRDFEGKLLNGFLFCRCCHDFYDYGRSWNSHIKRKKHKDHYDSYILAQRISDDEIYDQEMENWLLERDVKTELNTHLYKVLLDIVWDFI